MKLGGHLGSGSKNTRRSSEIWCRRRIEQISTWTEHVRNEEVLKGVTEKRNSLLQTIKIKEG